MIVTSVFLIGFFKVILFGLGGIIGIVIIISTIGFFVKTKLEVKPNQVGFVYKKNIFYKKLEPGKYKFSENSSDIQLYTLPTVSKFITYINQEVLTKDNIALRFSYVLTYTITNPEKFLSKFELSKDVIKLIAEGESYIHSLSQIHLRNCIAVLNSEEINDRRNSLFDGIKESIQPSLTEWGILLESVMLKDLTFPKFIQGLFSKQLETKIRAKADLDNARTAVATARALKNASELMKDDENIKFVQLLETITKIASTGNHTFVLGQLTEMINK